MVHQYSFILIFFSFTFMDVMALATSLTSVVVFLSILTSPYELWDFHKSLPRKLNLGFALLFLSLMTTMLAFSATMLLTIRLEWKNWTSTLIYSAAFFPVTIFAMIQFPVYVMTRSIVKHLWKQIKKVLPMRLVKCFTNLNWCYILVLSTEERLKSFLNYCLDFDYRFGSCNMI